MLGIEQYFSKIADYCGFKVEGERGYNPQGELARKLDVDTKGAKLYWTEKFRQENR